MLTLEITETVLMADTELAVRRLVELKELGVRLALDDFGTGYSSLIRLQRLAVSEVKIDASFVRRIAESEDDYRIVRSIVDLVRSLGLRSVAEGVESDEVAMRLDEMGCDMGQGWLFGLPMPAADATVWLREHTGAGPGIEYGYQPEVSRSA
jgi:EAL domain-containing protein (putative c-di-GMP-specific phosphodiesterase class I)